MELDTFSYIIEDYLNNKLVLDIQKIIFNYLIDDVIYRYENKDFYIMDLYLRKLYKVTYLDDINRLQNNFNSNCINNGNIIINFKNNYKYNLFIKLLNIHNIISYNVNTLTNHGQSIILKENIKIRKKYSRDHFSDLLRTLFNGNSGIYY